MFDLQAIVEKNETIVRFEKFFGRPEDESKFGETRWLEMPLEPDNQPKQDEKVLDKWKHGPMQRRRLQARHCWKRLIELM